MLRSIRFSYRQLSLVIVAALMPARTFATDPRTLSHREPMTMMKNESNIVSTELTMLEDGKMYRVVSNSEPKTKFPISSKLIEKCPAFVLRPAGKGRTKHVRVLQLFRFSEQQDSPAASDGYQKIRICDYGESSDEVALEVWAKK